jgi:ribonuclease HI
MKPRNLSQGSAEAVAAVLLVAVIIITAIALLFLVMAVAIIACAPSQDIKSPRAVAYGASFVTFPNPTFHFQKEAAMSGLPGRRRAQRRLAGAHVRQIPAEAHEGNCEDFLRRHEQEARSAARGSARQRQEFAECLAQRAADSRNVRLAVEHVATRGGQAPGPNRHRLRDLDDRARWSLARALATSLETGQYEAGPERIELIPKRHGNGTRPIRIQNMEDRVAQRAIVQATQPFLDVQFSDRSFGYRPRRTREEALATAFWLARQQGLWVWIAEDARNAFENVPHGRLVDVLRRLLGHEEILELIQRACLDGRQRGIRQGGPLSPLLLNVYLHWMLDKRWSKLYPGEPLIRVADDLLVLCRDWETARQRYSALQGMLCSAGMALKGDWQRNIRDMRAGQKVTWLGYEMALDEEGLSVQLTEDGWEGLQEHLHLAQEEHDAPLLAWQSALDWIAQQGAAYRQEDVGQVHTGISLLMREEGYTEVPGRDQVEACWHRGYLRWARTLREALLRLHREPTAGSAAQHVAAALHGREGGTPVAGAPPTTFTLRREVSLFCDGACLSPSRTGGWAYVLVDPTRGEPVCRADSAPRTTNNRMELMAAIRGLEALEEPCRVRLVVDSQYVRHGVTEGLPLWKANGWRCGGGGHRRPVANARLWRRLDALLQYHQVDCRWVRGHSGHPENELADRLARQAAMRQLRIAANT